MRDPRERLKDILEAILHIQRHTAKGRQAFDQDELVQNWCVRLVGSQPSSTKLAENGDVGINEDWDHLENGLRFSFACCLRTSAISRSISSRLKEALPLLLAS